MATSAEFKTKEGKVLNLSFDAENGIINMIKIRGSFFLYPEDKLEIIEKALKGAEIKNVKTLFEELIKKEQITVIGFTGEELEQAIQLNLHPPI